MENHDFLTCYHLEAPQPVNDNPVTGKPSPECTITEHRHPLTARCLHHTSVSKITRISPSQIDLLLQEQNLHGHSTFPTLPLATTAGLRNPVCRSWRRFLIHGHGAFLVSYFLFIFLFLIWPTMDLIRCSLAWSGCLKGRKSKQTVGYLLCCSVPLPAESRSRQQPHGSPIPD